MLQGYRVGVGLRPFELNQQLFQRVQVRRLRLLEQRDQHHALQPVHGQLLQARPATAAPVEQAPGFGRWRGQGGQQVGVQCGEGVGVHR